jgi:hypothetical protein
VIDYELTPKAEAELGASPATGLAGTREGALRTERTAAALARAEDYPDRHAYAAPDPYAINGVPACGAPVDGGRCGRRPDHDGHPHIMEPGTDETEPEPEPCPCWSCDSECGSGCGPVKLTHRGLICGPCARRADVFDDDRTGTKVTISGDRVRLDVDTFRSFHTASTFLDLADVDALVAALLVKRTELARERQA